MVYGKIGRTGVYQMQDLLKRLNQNVDKDNYTQKINIFKQIYKNLPETNLFTHTEKLIDVHNISDNVIVDLLLHCQDRAYTIPELYEWIENSQLNLIDFVDYKHKYKNKLDIDNFENLSKIDQYYCNELYYGDIIKHSFYLSKQINTKADINDLNNILVPFGLNEKMIKKIYDSYNKENNIVTCEGCFYYRNYNCYSKPGYGGKISFIINDITCCILKYINNFRSIKEIFGFVRDDLNIELTDNELLEVFKPLYEKLEMFDLLLLRSK